MSYIPGSHYAICDICGLRFQRVDMAKNWQGLLVDRKCFELRNEQDIIRVRRDKISVADPRPEGQPVFLNPGDVTPDDL